MGSTNDRKDWVGVGMGLKCKMDGHLEVTGIIPDGPVAKSGKIRIGDTLRRVNGKEVGKSVSSARELLVGPPGTAVSLNLTRHESLFGIDAVKVENSFVVSVLREKCGESPRKGASPPVRRRPDSTARQMVDYTAEEFEPLSGFEGSAPSKSPKAMLQAGEDGGEKRLPGLLGGADSEAGGGRRGVDGGGGGGVDTRRSLELERRRREAAEAREAQSREELKSALRDLDKSRRALSEIKTERDLEREETASLSASFSRASQEAADLAVVVEELTEEVQSVRRENNAMRRERSGGGGAGGRSESQRELEGLRAEVSRLKGALEREKDEHLDSRSTLTDLVEALKDSLSQTETMLDGSRSREGQLKLQISRLTQELDNLGETDLAGDGRRRGSALLAKKLEEAQQTLQQERAQWQVEALEYRDKLSAAQTVIAGLRSKSRTTSSNGSEAGDSEEAQNHRALVERLEADVRAANQERLEMVKMVETFKSAVAHAKMHVQGAQEEREATEQRLEQALAEGEALGKEVAELEGSLRKSQEMTVALTNDKLEQQRSLASSEKKVMSLQREVEEVKGAVEALELELGEARNGLVDRDGAVAKLEGEVESMKGCLSKAEEEREANQSRKAELLRSLSSAESTVTELRRRVDLAEARVSEAEERSKEAEEEGEKAAKHVEECERELSVASSRIQGLEADVMRLKGDLSKSVAELEASKVVQETVAIEAAEAVERQLQEYKQVVLEREGEAKELRRLRASIEEERDGLRVKVGEMEGKLADAASAVEERDAFEGKASELERELAKERESWGVREGALCSELEVSRSDISRLEKEVEVLEGRLRDAERERGDAEGKVGELSVAMDDFRRAHQEASAAWVVQEQELNRELKDAREHVGRMEEDAAEAKREREEALQGSRGEVARLEEEMKEKVMRLEKEKEEKVMRLEKEKEEAQQQAERVRIDLQGAQEEAEGLRSSLGESREALRGMQIELEGAQSALRDAQGALELSRATHLKLEKAQGEAQGALEESHVQLERARVEKRGLGEALQGVQGELEKAQGEKRGLQEELVSLREAFEVSQESLRAAEATRFEGAASFDAKHKELLGRLQAHEEASLTQRQEMETELHVTREKLEEAQRELEKAHRELQDTQQELRLAADSLKNAHESAGGFERERDAAVASLRASEAAAVKHRELLEESRQGIQSLAMELEGVQESRGEAERELEKERERGREAAGEAERWRGIASEHKKASESLKAALELSKQKESAESRSHDEDAAMEMARAKAQVLALEDQVAALTDRKLELMQRVSGVEEEALSLREEKVVLMSTVSETESELVSVKSELKGVQSELESARDGISAAKARLTSSWGEQTVLRGALAEARADAGNFKRRMEEAEEAKARAREEKESAVVESSMEVARLSDALSAEREFAQQLSAQVSSLGEELRGAIEEKEEARASVREKERQIEQTGLDLDTVTRQLKQLGEANAQLVERNKGETAGEAAAWEYAQKMQEEVKLVKQQLDDVRRDADAKLEAGEARLGEARAEAEKTHKALQKSIGEVKKESDHKIMDLQAEFEKGRRDAGRRVEESEARRDAAEAELRCIKAELEACSRAQVESEARSAVAMNQAMRESGEREEELKADVTRLRGEVQRLSSELEALHSVKDSLEVGSRSAGSEAARLSAEMSRLVAEVEQGRRREEALSEELDQARMLAQQALQHQRSEGSVGDSREVIDREVENLKSKMREKDKRISGQAIELESLRQNYNLKAKEQLERTQKERAKIADEMRSAFQELTSRQIQLEASSDLISKLETEVGVLRDALSSTGASDSLDHIFKALEHESSLARSRLSDPAVPQARSAMPASPAGPSRATPPERSSPPAGGVHKPDGRTAPTDISAGAEAMAVGAARPSQATFSTPAGQRPASKGLLRKTDGGDKELRKKRNNVVFDLGDGGETVPERVPESDLPAKEDTVSL